MQTSRHTAQPEDSHSRDLERMRKLERPSLPNWRLLVALVGYQTVLLFLLPIVFLRFLKLSYHEPEYRRHFLQRMGFGPVAPKPCVWVFAASLGETRAASPVVKHFLESGYGVCFACSTPAGLQEARRLFSHQTARVVARYAPLDFLPFVLIFFLRQRPVIGLVVEGELWPGYLTLGRLLGCPMMKINGNIIERSVERNNRSVLGRLRYEFMKLYFAVLTKTPSYRDRYLRAGVPDQRVFCVGELKFDQWLPQEQLHAGQRLKDTWSPTTPILTIASTIEEEEDPIFGMVSKLIAHPAKPRIIWVPRSPQRFDRVASRLAGLCRTVRRSEALNEDLSGPLPEGTMALVGDSIGEMNFYIASADLVFVGATIADRGGHNIVEPLALKKPVLVGPSVRGIVYPALVARDDGALYIADGIEDLTRQISEILDDSDALDAFTVQTSKFSEKHLGASRRTFELAEVALKAW